MNVFVDADGVITNFDSHVMSFSGGIHPNKLGDENMWKLVDSIPDFWISMPFFPWAHDLIGFIRNNGYDPVVLTGCPKTNYEVASEQKKAKFDKKFPGLPVITCLSKNKPDHMIAPGDLLIDDRHSNLKRWVKAGGIAVLFRTYEQTITELEKIFAK